MIIFNITTMVSHPINDRWLQWMKEDQIPAIMNTGLFHDYRMCRLLEQDEEDGLTYSVQFFADTQENYQTYIDEYAPVLQKRAYDLFGSQFVAFRTVMQVV
ncbi:DUF4286 family protein [Chitinophaga sancti]|uniref:DUF4286 family protein n=1 Tax=Chitinophaga sancti TaxID=1004 RepID=A0A1K1RHY7_9BACT|nr:DUF4286 family protein [Chitinophaga sancti]WQD60589.1 DUF4286 family protein [Chitinophaga sancti]WQG87283.1 DUF4286 family protein [Chitinophaga sancti]SFW71302.1 protein of unknown function [Chitinophaga sancti]